MLTPPPPPPPLAVLVVPVPVLKFIIDMVGCFDADDDEAAPSLPDPDAVADAEAEADADAEADAEADIVVVVDVFCVSSWSSSCTSMSGTMDCVAERSPCSTSSSCPIRSSEEPMRT